MQVRSRRRRVKTYRGSDWIKTEGAYVEQTLTQYPQATISYGHGVRHAEVAFDSSTGMYNVSIEGIHHVAESHDVTTALNTMVVQVFSGNSPDRVQENLPPGVGQTGGKKRARE